MKILLVSDVEDSYIWDYFDKERFKDIELILSCGDVKAEYLSFLVTLIKAPLFYVHGNHDKDYLKNPPSGCECIDGRLLNWNGIRIMGLGGSFAYNMGPFQFTEKKMSGRIFRMMPALLWNRGFDILLSHAPAYGICDGKDLCHRGFQCFTNLLEKYNPRYFIHGHQHLSYGNAQRIVQYKQTTVINAYRYHILEYGQSGL